MNRFSGIIPSVLIAIFLLAGIYILFFNPMGKTGTDGKRFAKERPAPYADAEYGAPGTSSDASAIPDMSKTSDEGTDAAKPDAAADTKVESTPSSAKKPAASTEDKTDFKPVQGPISTGDGSNGSSVSEGAARRMSGDGGEEGATSRGLESNSRTSSFSGGETGKDADDLYSQEVDLSVLDTATSEILAEKLMGEVKYFHLIAGSFNTQQKAEVFYHEMLGKGYDPFIIFPIKGSSNYYRVSIYHHGTKAEVQRFSNSLKARGMQGGWIYEQR